MMYDLNNVNEVNGSYLVTALNIAFERYQTGEPDRECPLVNPAHLTGPDTIKMDTQQAGFKFEIAFNDYSAQLVAYDPDNDDVEIIAAGAIENDQMDFENEFANGCLKAIMKWWN